MSAYEYIKNHVNVKLCASKIHGVGVFALRDIDETEKLFVEWEGISGEYTLTNNELESLDEDVRIHLFDMYGYKEINGIFQMSVFLNKGCHWIFKTPLHWVNSCAFDEIPNINAESLTTNTKIKKGQELFTKYGKYNKFKPIRTI